MIFTFYFSFCCPPTDLLFPQVSNVAFLSDFRFKIYQICFMCPVCTTHTTNPWFDNRVITYSVYCDAVDFAAICILLLRYFTCLSYQIRDQHRLKRSNSTSKTCTPWNPSRTNGSHVHFCYNVKDSYVSWRLYFVCTDISSIVGNENGRFFNLHIRICTLSKVTATI